VGCAPLDRGHHQALLGICWRQGLRRQAPPRQVSHVARCEGGEGCQGCCNEGEGAANDAITIVREGARPGEYRFKFPTWNGARSAESHYDVAKGISVEVAPFGEAPDVRLLVSDVPFAC
jgi:hypothetical protein